MDKEQAALEQEEARISAATSAARVELEESRNTVVPKASAKRNRDSGGERREIRIESRIVEPDPTKTHEPSTWTGEPLAIHLLPFEQRANIIHAAFVTGRNFYTPVFPPNQPPIDDGSAVRRPSTLLGRLSGAFVQSVASDRDHDGVQAGGSSTNAAAEDQDGTAADDQEGGKFAFEDVEDDIDLEKSNVLML